jgi:SNF2 family DNA or RNA helicase
MWDNLIQSSTRMNELKTRHESREARADERAARKRANENAREAAGDAYQETPRMIEQRAADVREEVADQKEEEKDTTGFGCILAHSMGLGKTLQVISFVECYLRSEYGEHVLIVVPVNTIVNWEHEFARWLKPKPLVIDNLASNQSCCCSTNTFGFL